jgi:predicted aminopeptidase
MTQGSGGLFCPPRLCLRLKLGKAHAKETAMIPRAGSHAVSLKLLWLLAPFLLMAFGTGCQTGRYYSQAVRGQLQILTQREPIRELIARPDTPEELKEKLKLILELRAFAESELKLPVEDHYLRYFDLKRRFVVWNVHAAPEFSTKPKTWWYPVVGRLKYRGYFSEEDALDYAAGLQRKGYDVFVDGVEAYSTLGWFADPVLNTFVHHPESELAEILFHELAHQRLFISGDTDFNEAFATAVGEEGVRRWLEAKGKLDDFARYRGAERRNEEFVRIVLNARERLKALFGDSRHETTEPRSETEAERLREQKKEIIARLRRDYTELKKSWGGFAGYDRWFSQALNNAQLNTVATYYHLVPAFEKLLKQNGGDLEKFYSAVRNLSRMKKEDRHGELNRLL